MHINFKQNNFFFLLGALLFLLIIIPLAKDLYGKSHGFIGQLAFSSTLIFSVLGLAKSIKWQVIGLLLVLVGFICSYLFVLTTTPAMIYIALVSDLLFLMLIIFFAIHQVTASDTINLHNIFGTICIYILLGIIWSILYLLTYLLIPESFSGIQEVDQQIQLHDFLYFSFVTLTTLGYGDILPLSATAKTLAFVEAMFGQFYIAILVGGLVAMHISGQSKDKN